MKELILKDDRHAMNWIEGHTEWGTVRAPEGIETAVSSERQGELVKERYTFTNTTDRYIFTSLGDTAIYAPFNDDYTDSKTCLTNRCHTHIWCGGEISYVMALRMGGEPPHLGLVLTEGSLSGYSVERDLSLISNDRGDFLLHPTPAALAPGESITVGWTLFPHNGKADFKEKLAELCPRYIDVSAKNYVVFEGEKTKLKITPAFGFGAEDVSVSRRGEKANFEIRGGSVFIEEEPEGPGEYVYEIEIGGVRTFCRILVLPELCELAKRRCRFIIEKQQFRSEGSMLDGAYLIYDNEEGHMHYSREYDRNAGRERIGMGLLMAKYLQSEHDEDAEKSLDRYIKYVERELFDSETGRVSNDCRRDDSFKRLYNYPWMSLFYTELYTLKGRREYLINAYKIMMSFYEQGGAHFYAIEIPAARLVSELKKAGMAEHADALTEHLREHCDFILSRGPEYPAHEVNFEQSIAAPAAITLFDMYRITGEQKYLDGAKEQLAVLELFNGIQPDHHLYEVAIRHWDGYWFGKNRLYGDTFPHYWSALTANAYRALGSITGDKEYLRRAEAAYRGVLSLFSPDGSASCAYLYPVTCNGTRGGWYDPYANDQDWGLYFMLRSRA